MDAREAFAVRLRQLVTLLVILALFNAANWIFLGVLEWSLGASSPWLFIIDVPISFGASWRWMPRMARALGAIA